jgi:hypothetical protein
VDLPEAFAEPAQIGASAPARCPIASVPSIDAGAVTYLRLVALFAASRAIKVMADP